MFSMCGLLCRFLRGWRQSEAVNLMVQAAALSDASLIVEVIESADHSETNHEPTESEKHLLLCQPLCEIPDERQKQLIWRENNKQAFLITPKERVDLERWIPYVLSSSSSAGVSSGSNCIAAADILSCPPSLTSTPINSVAPSRHNSLQFETQKSVTVLLEARYCEKGSESSYRYNVKVEHLAEPYAWKARDAVAIIIRTTPKKLVSMIHAFFSNALIISDGISIQKILTVELYGEPSPSTEPSTVSSCLSQGSGSGPLQDGHPAQTDFLKAISLVSPGLVSPEVIVKEAAPQLHNIDSASVVPENTSLLVAAKVSSQSSEDDGSFESDSSPLQLHQLCPRGWAISGLKSKSGHHDSRRVVMGQPLSVNPKLASLECSRIGTLGSVKQIQDLASQPSIITNPLNELLSVKEAFVAKTSDSKLCENDREKRVTFALSNSSSSSTDNSSIPLLSDSSLSSDISPLVPDAPQPSDVHQVSEVPHSSDVSHSHDLPPHSAKAHQAREHSVQSKRSSRTSRSSPSLVRQTASFHGRENYHKRKGRHARVTDGSFEEPKLHQYPVKVKSEADLLKATAIIRENLANIIENYLRKSPTAQQQHHTAENGLSVKTGSAVAKTDDDKMLLLTNLLKVGSNSNNNNNNNNDSNSNLSTSECSSSTQSALVSDISTDVVKPRDFDVGEGWYLNKDRDLHGTLRIIPGVSVCQVLPNVHHSESRISTSVSLENLSLLEAKESSSNSPCSHLLTDLSHKQSSGTLVPKEIDNENGTGVTVSSVSISEEELNDAKVSKDPFLMQDSTESEVGDYSFSEDSLNEKVNVAANSESVYPVTGGDAAASVISSCHGIRQDENHVRIGLENISISNLLSDEKIHNSFSDDSLETNGKRRFHVKCKDDDFSVVSSKSAEGASEVTDVSLDSLERENLKICETSGNVDANVVLEFKPVTRSASIEDNSLSEDSLGSEFASLELGIKELMLSDLNQQIDSSVSTPDEFSIKSDSLETLSSTAFPQHWHEEYVKVFSNVNEAMSQEVLELYQQGLESTSSTLEPIKELDTLSKGSSSPVEVAEECDEILKNTAVTEYSPFVESMGSQIGECFSVLATDSIGSAVPKRTDDGPQQPQAAEGTGTVCSQSNEMLDDLPLPTHSSLTSAISSHTTTYSEFEKVRNSLMLIQEGNNNEISALQLPEDKVDLLQSGLFKDKDAETENIEKSLITNQDRLLKSEDPWVMHANSLSDCDICDIHMLKKEVNELLTLGDESCFHASANDEKHLDVTEPQHNIEQGTLQGDYLPFTVISSHGEKNMNTDSEIEGQSVYISQLPHAEDILLQDDMKSEGTFNTDVLILEKEQQVEQLYIDSVTETSGFINLEDTTHEKSLQYSKEENTVQTSQDDQQVTDILSLVSTTESFSYFDPDETFAYTSAVKAVLSPVDSAPESGFVSLKDSSHSEGTSDSGSVVPLSKSKDSLEMTDSEKAPGADNFSDEFDLYSAVTGDHMLPGSSPASISSSTRSSLMDVNAGQTNELIFGCRREFDIMDIENVCIPSQQFDTSTLLPSSDVPVKLKHHKYMRNASLDPENLTYEAYQERISELFKSEDKIVPPNLEMKEIEQQAETLDKRAELQKSGSEDSESQVLKTSDSVSSSDTVISKTSFDEQGRPLSKDFTAEEQQLRKEILGNDQQNSLEYNVVKDIDNANVCTVDIDSGHKPLDTNTTNDYCNKLDTLSKFSNHENGHLAVNNNFLYTDGELINSESQCSHSTLLSKTSKDKRRSLLTSQEILNCKAFKSLQEDKSNVNKAQELALLQTSRSCDSNPVRLQKDEILAVTEYVEQVPSSDHMKEGKRKRLAKKYKMYITDIDIDGDRLDVIEKKDENKNSGVTHFHSEGELDWSKPFANVDPKYKTKSVTSFNNSTSTTSSGETIADKASLKSENSLDKFTHFEAVRARPKPRTGPRRKVFSVDAAPVNKEKTDSIHRSVTLPSESMANENKEEKKKQKDDKSKKKKKEKEREGEGSDKKSALLSLKGFLKRSKTKEKEKESDTGRKLSTSPSLFRKLEKKAREMSSSPQNGQKKKTMSSSQISHPHMTSILSDTKSEQSVPSYFNDKTHLDGYVPVAVDEGSSDVGVKSTLQRSDALASSIYYSGSESEHSPSQSNHTTPKTSPYLRRTNLNDSPRLYRQVLMRNISDSQESLDTSLNAGIGVSSKHPVQESTSLPLGRDLVSPVPVMGTRALKSSPKCFSVTIGFKPQVSSVRKEDSAGINRTVSVGEGLQQNSGSTTPSRGSNISAASSLTKRSSSMEILVCGKIREHNPSRRQTSSGCSREGSFRLHREISVETLFEVPEVGTNISANESENYQEYLHRVQASRDSRKSSTWSLCENDGSIAESLQPDSLSSHLSQPLPHNSFQSHSPLGKKLSLPHSMYLSGPSEISNSNPNLSGVSSPFQRGIPLSSSFTSSPYRRPHSASSNFSPAKRGFASQGKNVTSPGNDSCSASPLVEEEEDFEPVRVNADNEICRLPNVLVYTGNNTQYYESVKETLENSFNRDRYIIYHLTDEMAFKSPWVGSTTLLVVCGDVTTHVSTVFIRFLLDGGRVLSVCSDFLNVAVPLLAFKLPWTSSLVESGTVEVQEASVVSMSYNQWKNVQLLHHQHCFHSSPKHKRFSADFEKKKTSSGSAVSVEPTHVEITDEYGVHHRLDLKVLAKDDTWGAPSLLLANVNDGKGKALFSQVHLERDAKNSIVVDLKDEQLKKCDEARIEILRDLLQTHLGIDTTREERKERVGYTSAYLLGRHEIKQKFLEEIRQHANNGEVPRVNLTLRFQQDKSSAKKPSEDWLPVLLTGYPNNFSTVTYFEALKTNKLGRLAIYSDIVTSTMDVLSGSCPLEDGLVVLATQQTQGRGRSSNLWLSPLGCAMFSAQLHIPVVSSLGQCLPFLQHLVAMASVLAVKRMDGYEDIPLRLKWPNDMYLGLDTKIGGVIVDVSTQGGTAIANIGCGINLSNSNPTTCINDAIQAHNSEQGTRLKEIDRETFYANCFNQLEKLIDDYQTKGADSIIDEYYKLWLHGYCNVTVKNELGFVESATIIGIDQYGFLTAQLQSGEVINLHPDGNSFNMMAGLIYTKILPRS